MRCHDTKCEKKYVFSLVKEKNHIFWEKTFFFHNWRKNRVFEKKTYKFVGSWCARYMYVFPFWHNFENYHQCYEDCIWFAKGVKKPCAMLAVKKAKGQSGDVALMKSLQKPCSTRRGIWQRTRGSINRASLATKDNKSLPPQTVIMKHSPRCLLLIGFFYVLLRPT